MRNSLLEPATLKGDRPKYLQMLHEMRERIEGGAYAPGDRIPTIREMAKEFSVSGQTAFRVLQELSREQLVETSRGRRGTIVAGNERRAVGAKRTTLACLLRPHGVRNEDDNWGLDVMQGIRDEISARGFRFVYHGLDEENYEERMRDLVKEPWVAGIILDCNISREAIRRLSEQRLPATLFNRIEHFDNLSCVTPDYERVARENVRFLLNRGYDRLAFYRRSPLPDGSYPPAAWQMLEMTRGFEDELAARRFPREKVVVLPDLLPAPGPDLTPEHFGLPRRKGKEWAPLGIFTNYDIRAQQLIRVISQTDLVLGRDIGVIGCLDIECARMSATPPSTWRIDRQMVGAETVREMLRRIAHPESSRAVVKLNLDFVDRGTA